MYMWELRTALMQSSNVLLDGNNGAVLADVGLACSLGLASHRQNSTVRCKLPVLN